MGTWAVVLPLKHESSTQQKIIEWCEKTLACCGIHNKYLLCLLIRSWLSTISSFFASRHPLKYAKITLASVFHSSIDYKICQTRPLAIFSSLCFWPLLVTSHTSCWSISLSSSHTHIHPCTTSWHMMRSSNKGPSLPSHWTATLLQ